ncbi:MAG: hypothetical protein U5L96_11975 [Owenweeksia sp.]|nr:hypothetical protein [Owenweeksia sp.]
MTVIDPNQPVGEIPKQSQEIEDLHRQIEAKVCTDLHEDRRQFESIIKKSYTNDQFLALKKANPADRYREVADYLILKYSLRYNELRMCAEFHNDQSGKFVELDEYHANSWFIELKANGFSVSDQIY